MARRTARSLATALALLALLALSGCVTLPSPPKAAPADVIVVVCRTLGWADVISGDMPATRMLAEQGATGLVVSRTPERARQRLDIGTDAGSPGGFTSTEAKGTPAEVDLLVAEAVGYADPGASVVVVALPAATQAGFVVISGSGYGPGLLTSASTRRRGIVTDADIQTTLIRITGAEPAAGAQGVAAGTLATDDTATERLTGLVELETFLGAMDSIRYPLLSGFTVLLLVLVIAGWRVAETRRDRPRYAYVSLVLRRALLFGLALPAGGTLLFIIERLPQSPARIVTQLLGATALMWLFAQFAWHKWGTGAAVAFIGLITAGVVAADQLVGAPLSVSALVSYSPLMALRFYGLGNEGAAILVGSALTGIALELDAARTGGAAMRRAVVAVGVITVGIAAAPLFGANVIVALWGTVTFAVFYALAGGGRFGWRQAGVTLLLAVLAVVAAVLLDRFVGAGTHIARAVGEASGGGLPALALARARTALSIFVASPLPVVVLTAAIGFGYLCARPRGVMAATLRTHPLFRAALTAGLAGGLVGALVEDSGLVILALLLLYLAGALTMLMLEPDDERPQGRGAE